MSTGRQSEGSCGARAYSESFVNFAYCDHIAVEPCAKLTSYLHCFDRPPRMIPRRQKFRLGRFTFSRAEGLQRDDRPVRLRHLERQIVKCLLDRPGEIVRKEELMTVLWPDSKVSDNTLNVHIRRLRITLGDTKKPHRLLKCVARMGFMLVATPKTRRLAPSSEPARGKGDRSRFIRDVTVPDGSVVAPGEQFEKVWEIQNAGSVPWCNRHFRRTGVCSGPGRLSSEPLTPVPTTNPGQLCLMRMQLTAPSQPGSYYAEWKMVDKDGNLSFLRQAPLFVSIDVVVE
jgi:DNA-binding winged helix-turn-helix (wHTH) protein